MCASVYMSVDTDRYMCMMPIMNTMLEKCEHMLNVSAYLPNIPHSDASPTFCDDFRSYLQSNEWMMFMKKQACCIWLCSLRTCFVRFHHQTYVYSVICYLVASVTFGAWVLLTVHR